MNRFIRPQTHPFPFLLYLEWGLLTTAILSEFLPGPFPRVPRLPLAAVISITGFGLMGLRLPTGKRVDKIAYIALEIGLTLIATFTGVRRLRLFPVLYLIMVIRSCFMLKHLWGRLVVTAVALTMFVVVLSHRLQSLSAKIPRLPGAGFRQAPSIFDVALNFSLLFGLVLLFVLLLVNALLAERQSRDRLTLANEKLRQYALRVENLATFQERNRIARDIHDSLGHSLTALNIQLESALKLSQTEPTKAQTFLQAAKQSGSQALKDVRQSVAALRADPLAGQSLPRAIATLAQDFHRTTGVMPDCDIQLPSTMPTDISTAAYRIIQEALTNSCRYATATRIQINLQATSMALTIMVQDNGVGFRPDQNTTGFGLQGMRERTLALGGRFTLESQPGSGCRIVVHLPW
ncbi:MAG: sensor histidine kinase [Cyanothece sp. SIO1E1]|nr:sensor histidine kinase [Cyanothece sp. SIO1E1]